MSQSRWAGLFHATGREHPVSGPAAFRASVSAAPRDLRMDGHRVCPLAAVKPGPIRHGG